MRLRTDDGSWFRFLHNGIVIVRNRLAPSARKAPRVVETLVVLWQANGLDVILKNERFIRKNQRYVVEKSSGVIFGMNDDSPHSPILVRQHFFIRFQVPIAGSQDQSRRIFTEKKQQKNQRKIKYF